MFVFYFNANSICLAQSLPSFLGVCWDAQVASGCSTEFEVDFQRQSTHSSSEDRKQLVLVGSASQQRNKRKEVSVVTLMSAK